MTVRLWLSGELNPELIDGSLLGLTEQLNIAAANGFKYAVLEGSTGLVMVQTSLITKAREGDDDTDIGW